jgi:hypothetical protein
MPGRHEHPPLPAQEDFGFRIMLNRAALILRYNKPFVDWINAADPSPTSHALTLAEVNREHTVYLVEVEDEDELAQWLEHNHQKLFEEELSGWYTEPALWPRDRSLQTLQEWCSFELHTVVVDAGESPLEDDDLEE